MPDETTTATNRKRIVVGVDGSETSRAALVRAADEATAHGAQLEIVHAWSYLDQPGPTFDPDYGEVMVRQRIEAFVADVLGSDGEGRTVQIINDRPSPALLEAAVGAFTLVVGARGLGGFRGMVLGSVSQHTVHHARCPVLVVR